MSQPLQKIAIVGASGRFGTNITEDLIKSGKHTITALTRLDSTSKEPEGVNVVRVDYADHAGLVSALRGQQMLIITLSGMTPPEVHSGIVKAAIEAGVPYIMPNAYGFDYTNKTLIEGEMYSKGVVKLINEIRELGGSHLVLCCGFWFEWSITAGLEWYGFDIKNRKVVFFDDGKTKINTTTWKTCGKAIAALLALPEKAENGQGPAVEQWVNKPLFVSSFHVSQRDMLDSLNRVLGTTDKDWDISYEPTEKRVADGFKEMQGGDMKGFAKSMYSRIFYPDGSGEYESKGLANETLGLPKEDIDEAMKRVIKFVDTGKNVFTISGADMNKI
ncbi:NAD(P)-binding protein [Lophiostoma macrostomum CBS 122681]|uniref:NAD(P)-binding protein n=1 Tax=Lophiostoma macrostomum CBS 122681 TaxID=1314788 RepID=A0A6A6SNK2_9PLEO|nr:NAD(P)-binding protein [Lophiostoma macrostomum CBS 122681]